MEYDNINSLLCQDSPERELKEKFEPKKLLSELLANSYSRISDSKTQGSSEEFLFKKKSSRVSECGSFLEFVRYHDFNTDVSDIKLHNANFCRDRMCPMCSWRRSLKIFSQVSQIMNLISNDYTFLFLTLTVPNCSSEALSDTISNISDGWSRFRHYKEVQSVVKGYFKALEITRNKSNGTFHPHIHTVLAVKKSYFNSRDYIQHDKWLSLWQKAMRDYSITQVDIRKAKSYQKEKSNYNLSSAVAEIAKYSVKPSDYIISDNEVLTDEIVSVLSLALNNRRLCSFGGVFDKARGKLGLDDCEDGDLLHIDDEIRSDLAVQIFRYGWSCGVYKLIDLENLIEKIK